MWKNNLKNNFCVKVNPEMSKSLQEKAFKNGYKWFFIDSIEIMNEDSHILFFYPETKQITHGDSYNDTSIISFNEAIVRLDDDLVY